LIGAYWAQEGCLDNHRILNTVGLSCGWLAVDLRSFQWVLCTVYELLTLKKHVHVHLSQFNVGGRDDVELNIINSFLYCRNLLVDNRCGKAPKTRLQVVGKLAISLIQCSWLRLETLIITTLWNLSGMHYINFLCHEVLLMLLKQDVTKSEQYQYIQEMINKHPVIVFSKTTCSFCAMAKNVLNEVGVQYEVEEIDRRNDTDKLQDIFAKITSARTVSYYCTISFVPAYSSVCLC